MMPMIQPARPSARSRSAIGAGPPLRGARPGFSVTDIQIAAMKSKVSSSPGNTPAMNSRPIDCSVRMA